MKRRSMPEVAPLVKAKRQRFLPPFVAKRPALEHPMGAYHIGDAMLAGENRRPVEHGRPKAVDVDNACRCQERNRRAVKRSGNANIVAGGSLSGGKMLHEHRNAGCLLKAGDYMQNLHRGEIHFTKPAAMPQRERRAVANPSGPKPPFSPSMRRCRNGESQLPIAS